MDGYSVENISLEMFPGYFVSGNLYTPLDIDGKIPAVLSPHGHWFKPGDYGRFREDMQLRCASLARMGAGVFAWDMFGTGEDIQHVHHSEDALTYQLYNGIRILDFIASLDDIDPDRIGITGASGGGTQTFLTAALDDRISVSVPTVMVSAHFYGGCVCESGKPIHKSGNFETNNVEIAASIAPKPLMIIGDGGDWTRNIATVEFPYILKIYELFDAGDKTDYAFFEDEVHDYGISKRTAAYGFLAEHLGLDISKIQDSEGHIDESFVTLLDTTQLKVFPDKELVKVP
jgi:dienelactone hydrolase